MDALFAILGSMLFWTISGSILGIGLCLMIAGIGFFVETVLPVEDKKHPGPALGGFLTYMIITQIVVLVPISAVSGLIWGIFPPARDILQQNGIGGTILMVLAGFGVLLLVGVLFGGIGVAKMFGVGSQSGEQQ